MASSNYYYKLNGPFLEITCSDSQQEHVDEARIPHVHNHADGHERVYHPQSNDSHLSKYWRRKLGTELAIKFLFKPKGNKSKYPNNFLSSNPSLTTSPVDYTLTKFPRGYKLFSHVKGNNHEVHRQDAYLYSMCLSPFLSCTNC
jgi:Transcription-silencing protein, cryptic loci regulator Clr2